MGDTDRLELVVPKSIAERRAGCATKLNHAAIYRQRQ
jgi:hypothetical protein